MVYDIVINEEAGGLELVSFVEDPAIEINWVAMNNNVKKQIFTEDGDKFTVTGPAMVVGQKIKRWDDDLQEEYFVKLEADSIRHAVEFFFRESNHTKTNINHGKELLGDVVVIESWFTSDNDKSKELGFELPNGSWIVTYKVNNRELWSKIKSGEVKGFSIEGWFDHYLSKFSKDRSMEKYDKILEDIKNITLSEDFTGKDIDKIVNILFP